MSKRIYAYIALCCLMLTIPVSLAAQEATTPSGLIVRSTPEGAQATLSGPVVVTGITPTFFRQPLVGDYKLEITRHGYENYSTHITLDPTRQMEVSVELSPKTRFKAAARSLLIPGWGQRYADENFKGYAFSFLAAGSITAFLIADHSYNNDYDRFEARVADYDSARADGASYQELSALHSRLVDAQNKAYDSENTRRITIGVVAGVWALNLIDVLFFFPNERGTFSVKGLTVEPNADLNSVGLTLSHRF
ncbi:MAG: DUF5683 domain-containing protein [Candidatus Zixiibacteriota bacterium]